MGSPFWKFLTMFIVIPIKPFGQVKTRLSPVLSLSDRIDLSRHLLRRTIQIAGRAGEVVVISRDASVRRLAKQAGAWALVESGTSLNQALQQAAEWVLTRGAEVTLIVPGDLPLLRLTDLVEIIEAGRQGPSVVIAPCRRNEGTNALLLRPPNLIKFAFGPGSFERHRQAARAIGVEPIIYRSPTIALDLDLPEDLDVKTLNGLSSR